MSRIRNSPRFKGLTVFISVLNIFLGACTENPENQKEIEWKGDFDTFENSFQKKEFKESNVSGAILYLKGETQPFSGSVERNSSHRLSRDKYQDGLLEGISIRKSVDGSWVEANYKAGKLHGRMTFYDSNGKIRTVMNFDHGVLKPEIAD